MTIRILEGAAALCSGIELAFQSGERRFAPRHTIAAAKK
jgi:hypothetical protein